mgnify:FL=1
MAFDDIKRKSSENLGGKVLENQWDVFIEYKAYYDQIMNKFKEFDKIVEDYIAKAGPDEASKIRNDIDELKRLLTDAVEHKADTGNFVINIPSKSLLGKFRNNIFIDHRKMKQFSQYQKNTELFTTLLDAIGARLELSTIDHGDRNVLRLLQAGFQEALTDDGKLAMVIWGRNTEKANLFLYLDKVGGVRGIIDSLLTQRRHTQEVRSIIKQMLDSGIELKDFSFDMIGRDGFIVTDSMLRSMAQSLGLNVSVNTNIPINREEVINLIRGKYANYQTDARRFLQLIQDHTGISFERGPNAVLDYNALYTYATTGKGKGSFSFDVMQSLQKNLKRIDRVQSRYFQLMREFYEGRDSVVEYLRYITEELGEAEDTLHQEGRMIQVDSKNNERRRLSYEQNLERLRGGGYDYNDAAEQMARSEIDAADAYERYLKQVGDAAGWTEAPMLKQVNLGTSSTQVIKEMIDGKERVFEIVNTGKPQIVDGKLVVEQLAYEIINNQRQDTLTKITKKIPGFMDRLEAARLLGETVNVDGFGNVLVESVDSNKGTFTFKKSIRSASDVVIDIAELKLDYIKKAITEKEDDIYRIIKDQVSYEINRGKNVLLYLDGTLKDIISRENMEFMFYNLKLPGDTRYKADVVERVFGNYIHRNVRTVLSKYAAWALSDPDAAITAANEAHLRALADIGEIRLKTKKEGVTLEQMLVKGAIDTDSIEVLVGKEGRALDFSAFMREYSDRFTHYFYQKNEMLMSDKNPILEKLIDEYNKIPEAREGKISLYAYLQNAIAASNEEFKMRFTLDEIVDYVQQRNLLGDTPFTEVSLEAAIEKGIPIGRMRADVGSEMRAFRERGILRGILDRTERNFMDRRKRESIRNISGTVLDLIENEALEGISRSNRKIVANKARAIYGRLWKVSDIVQGGTDINTALRRVFSKDNLRILDEKAMLDAITKHGYEPRENLVTFYREVVGGKAPRLNVQQDVLDTILEVYAGMEADAIAKMDINAKINKAVATARSMKQGDFKELAVRAALRGTDADIEEIIHIARGRAKIKAIRETEGVPLDVLGTILRRYDLLDDLEMEGLGIKPGLYGVHRQFSLSDPASMIKILEAVDEFKGTVDGREYTFRLKGGVPTAYDEAGREVFSIGDEREITASVFSERPEYITAPISQTTSVSDKIEIISDLDLERASRKPYTNTYMSQSSLESVQNLRKFFDKTGELKPGQKFTTIDYETTGLIGRTPSELMNIIEVNAQTYKIGEVSPDAVVKEVSMLVKPTEKVKEFIGGITDVSELSDAELWVLRNYAKYSPEVFDFRTSMLVDKERYLRYVQGELSSSDYERLLADARSGLRYVDEYGEDLITALTAVQNISRGSIIVGQNYADADALFRIAAIDNQINELMDIQAKIDAANQLEYRFGPGVELEREIAERTNELTSRRGYSNALERQLRAIDDITSEFSSAEDLNLYIQDLRSTHNEILRRTVETPQDRLKVQRDMQRIRDEYRSLSEITGIPVEELYVIEPEKVENYFNELSTRRANIEQGIAAVTDEITTLQQEIEARRVQLESAPVTVISREEIQNRIRTLEELRAQKETVIDQMALYPLIRPESEARNLQAQAAGLGIDAGIDEAYHIARYDAQQLAQVFGATVEEIAEGKHPVLREHLTHSSTLRRGRYVAKISGGNELGEIIHGVYKYQGIENLGDEGVYIYLQDVLKGRDDNLIVLKAHNLNEAKTILQKDYVPVSAKEAKVYQKYFAWDRTRRSVEDARKGYISLANLEENVSFVLGSGSTTSATENALAIYEEAIRKVAAGEALTREEQMIIANSLSKDMTTGEMLRQKLSELEKRYPEDKREGLRRLHYEKAREWLDSTEVSVLKPAYHKLKVLEDSGILTSSERGAITGAINNIVAEAGTRKTLEFPWLKSLGTYISKEAQEVTNLYINTSSLQSTRRSVYNVFELLQKREMAFTHTDLLNIINEAYPGLMDNADITNLNTIAYHLYKNREMLNVAQMEDYAIKLTKKQAQNLQEEIDKYINQRVVAKFESALSEDQINDIIKQVDDYTRSVSTDLPLHYIAEDIGIRLPVSGSPLVASQAMGDMVTIDQLFEFAQSYKQQDYYNLQMFEDAIARKKFDTRWREWMGMRPDEKINIFAEDYRAARDAYKQAIDENVKPILDRLQVEGIGGATQEQARIAWNEINQLLGRDAVDDITRAVRERLGWIDTDELIQLEGNIKAFRNMQRTIDEAGYDAMRATLEGWYDRLGQTILTGNQVGGLRFSEVSFAALNDVNEVIIKNEHMRRQAADYLELAKVLQKADPGATGNIAPLSEEVEKQLDNILDVLEQNRIRRVVASDATQQAAGATMRVVRETASDAAGAASDAAQGVMKSGFSGKALAGIAIAATLGGMLIGGATKGDPQERARQRKEREEAESNVVRGSGEADWAAQHARSATKLWVDQGRGARMKISARSTRGTRGEQIIDAVKDDLGKANVHIKTTDDTTTITKSWMEEMFLKILNG